MFVPRALRLKGIKEIKKKPVPDQTKTASATGSSLRERAEQASQEPNEVPATTLSKLQELVSETKPAVSANSNLTTLPITAEYLGQLVAGIELLFTDYAHQAKDSAAWLQKHYRTIKAGDRYIHLTAILDHPNISTLKPKATQSLLQRALIAVPSSQVEVSDDDFYVRRRPSTYPAVFVPSNSFEVMNDNGLSFWDQRTIYVEPHIRHMCKTPAKVAHWLKEHGQLKPKWLPVQAVHTLYNSCAFVVLSGNVMHEDQWRKWRASENPENWRVMTKVENLRRTEEYVALRKASVAEVAARWRGSGSIARDDERSRLEQGAPRMGDAGGIQQTAQKRDADTDLPHRTSKRRI